MMTKQEVFDTIWYGITKQNAFSYDPIADRCMYRGPNNTRCAIGLLIPDDIYDPVIEEKGIELLMDPIEIYRNPTYSKIFMYINNNINNDAIFMRALQYEHDRCTNSDIPIEAKISLWKILMKRVAIYYELTVPSDD